MDYKLEKIYTDSRLKIQEEASTNKVHYSKKINASRDYVEDRKKSTKNFSDTKKKSNKKYITIDGIKYGQSINVYAEKIEEIKEENTKGRILDMKK